MSSLSSLMKDNKMTNWMNSLLHSKRLKKDDNRNNNISNILVEIPASFFSNIIQSLNKYNNSCFYSM